MNSRQRILRALNHQEPDRVPVLDAVWPSTEERWRTEGLPSGVSVADHFGYEHYSFEPDLSPQFPTEIIEESSERYLERTAYGTLQRQRRDRASTPEVIDWAIRSRADWERIRPRLVPDLSRVDWPGLQQACQNARDKGRFIFFTAHIGYAHYLQYIKADQLLLLLAMEPEWVKEMFQVQAELVMGLAQMIMDGGIPLDGACMACDLGYRNATLFSPAMYRELQFPYDKMVFRFFRDKGMPVMLHSDGCVKALIPQFLEAGVNALHPLEVKAGMDLIELKREYGRHLTLVGGIDVRAMSDPDPRIIEDEIKRKFEVAMVGGGYVYHSDHSVPDSVSFERYSRIMELVRTYGAYS